MISEVIEAVTAGVDWLSMTLTESASNYHEWRQDAHLLLYNMAKEGYEVKQRSLLGYVGVSVGNNFVGVQDDRTLVQFTGHHAQEVYAELLHPEAHYARIDLQFTVKYEVMPVNRGRQDYRDCKHFNAKLPKPRQRRIDLFIGGNGGDTVYIGAPSSDQRGRIYNKEVQSEDVDYTRCWRYEVTLRNELCNAWLGSQFHSDMSAQNRVLAFTLEWFTERGVKLPAIQSGRYDIGILAKAVPSDAERKLKWLATQVVPTVNWLADMGYEYDIRELFYRITNDSHYPSCDISERVHLLDSV